MKHAALVLLVLVVILATGTSTTAQSPVSPVKPGGIPGGMPAPHGLPSPAGKGVGPKPDLPDTPRIGAFEGSPSVVKSGGTVTFRWTVDVSPISRSPISSIELVGPTTVGGGPFVLARSSSLRGEHALRLSDRPETVVYREFELQIRDQAGKKARKSIRVRIVPPPVITAFSATPASLTHMRAPVNLAWDTRNAGSIQFSIRPGDPTVRLPYPVPLTGAIDVAPWVTTTYRITATNETGDTASREIVVPVEFHYPDLFVAWVAPEVPVTRGGRKGYERVSIHVMNQGRGEFVGVMTLEVRGAVTQSWTNSGHLTGSTFYLRRDREIFYSGETYRFDITIRTDNPDQEYPLNNHWEGSVTVPSY